MSFLRQFDQTYHKHWLLKCQLKKESHESLRNIPGLFNAASVERASRYLPSLSDQLEQTVMGRTPQQSPFLLLAEPQTYLLQSSGKGQRIPSIKGNTSVVSGHCSDPNLLGRYFRSGSGTGF